MSRNLQPYQRALSEAEAEPKAKLANGRSSASEVAVARRAWEITATQLRSSPDSVLVYERVPADPRTGLRGADRWRLDVYRQANDELFPHLAGDAASAAYTRKQQEYLSLGLRIVRSPDMR